MENARTPSARTRVALAAVAVAAASALLVLAAPSPARANARFPRAQHLVVGPGPMSSTLLLRATFGLVVSDDAAQTFRFICEEVFGYPDGTDPTVALAGDRTILVGLPDGLATLAPGRCEHGRVATLQNYEVIDLATDPRGGVVLAAVATTDVARAPRVARSDDAGRTFRVAGDGLPAGMRLETVEIAPSNAARVYASGTFRDPRRAVVLRSDDGGATFRVAAEVPGASGAFVSAVDPTRPDVVYVRAEFARTSAGDAGADGGSALDPPTALLRSDDGASTLREVARTAGAMEGFAISDDGRTVWVGGPNARDGLLRSDDGGPFRRVGQFPVECLRYHAGALYACTTYSVGSDMLVRVRDDGTPATLARFADVQGPPVCRAGSNVQDICPLRWPAVRARIDPPEPQDPDAGRDGALPGRDDAPPRPASCPCAATPGARGAREGGGGGAGGALAALALALSVRARRRAR